MFLFYRFCVAVLLVVLGICVPAESRWPFGAGADETTTAEPTTVDYTSTPIVPTSTSQTSVTAQTRVTQPYDKDLDELEEMLEKLFGITRTRQPRTTVIPTRGTFAPGVPIFVDDLPFVCNPNVCEDRNPQRCSVYMRNNMCRRNPIVARNMCQRSCGNCDCSTCIDSPIAKNQCKFQNCHYLMVRKACPKTCGMCLAWPRIGAPTRGVSLPPGYTAAPPGKKRALFPVGPQNIPPIVPRRDNAEARPPVSFPVRYQPPQPVAAVQRVQRRWLPLNQAIQTAPQPQPRAYVPPPQQALLQKCFNADPNFCARARVNPPYCQRYPSVFATRCRKSCGMC